MLNPYWVSRAILNNLLRTAYDAPHHYLARDRSSRADYRY